MTAGPDARWRPGRGSAVVLALALGYACWFFTPIFWTEIGGDSKVFYASAIAAERGLNAYDPQAVGRVEEEVFNVPQHRHPGDYGYVYPGVFAYPPLFLVPLAVGTSLPWVAYFVGGAVLMGVAGLAALELTLAAVGWRRRWWPRAFFLASTPLAQTLFDWNPSTLIFLAWAAALLLMVRGRHRSGGAVLSLCLLKLSVGLPVALVLLATGVEGPRAALRHRFEAAVAFLGAAAVLAAANLAAAGPEGIRRWAQAMTGMGLHLGNATPGRDPYRQTELAGLPAVFLDHLPLALALLLSVLAVGALLAWTSRSPGSLEAFDHEPLLFTALTLAAGLLLLPYLHVNDLVLEALPLLLVVSREPRPISRAALLAWFVGTPTWFVLAITAGILFHLQPEGTVGFGLLLTSLTLLALTSAVRRLSSPRPLPRMQPT